jgi:carboxypeptidase PM20D1
MIKKFFRLLGLVLLTLVIVLLIKTVLYTSRQHTEQALPPVAIPDACLTHLSAAVKWKTIAQAEGQAFDSVPFLSLAAYLKQTYPLADSLLHRKTIAGLSLLYTWQGRNTKLKPLVLIGHLDVVPVLEGPGDKWDCPPFSGELKDGSIYGRGTLDDKVNVVGLLESVEMLLKEGFQPDRTIYLAFGHDEETGGSGGAANLAAWFESQHIQACCLLDEGLVITTGIVPGISNKVALIGIAEKGYVSYELSVETPGGHSSMPAPETPIGILSAAVSALEKHPMPAHITLPVEQFLDYIGPEMPFLQRIAFANRWLLQGLIIRKYKASHAGNAIVRTTTAPTIFNSGTKDNVLPGYAAATINFRILPGENAELVLQHIRKVIKDPRVQIKRVSHLSEPGGVSHTDCREFDALQKTIRQIFPQTLSAPSLVIAGTDARYYSNITENLYRFVPLIAGPDDLQRIHGANERISTENFKDCIRFYRQLILNFNTAEETH